MNHCLGQPYQGDPDTKGLGCVSYTPQQGSCTKAYLLLEANPLPSTTAGVHYAVLVM